MKKPGKTELSARIAKHCGDFREEDYPEAEHEDLIHKFGCSDITPEQMQRLAQLDAIAGKQIS